MHRLSAGQESTLQAAVAGWMQKVLGCNARADMLQATVAWSLCCGQAKHIASSESVVPVTQPRAVPPWYSLELCH